MLIGGFLGSELRAIADGAFTADRTMTLFPTAADAHRHLFRFTPTDVRIKFSTFTMRIPV